MFCACIDCTAARAEIESARDEINRAYWSFTRRARSAPPTSAASSAYDRKRAAEAAIARHRPRRPTRHEMRRAS